MMATTLMSLRTLSLKLMYQNETKYLSQCIIRSSCVFSLTQTRNKSSNLKRRANKHRPWWMPKNIKHFDDKITSENKIFMKTFEDDTFAASSPLKEEPWPRETWDPQSVRTGVIARKIGIYPQWLTNGKRVLTTLLQVLDNHVIKHYPYEEYIKTKAGESLRDQHSVLIVGADAGSPQTFTKAYCGLFKESGVLPKKKLIKSFITDNAKIKPGTPLSAMHFRAGQYVDVSGRTISRGFQGVMKRWGMKGGPASHGHTKNHRRMGSIGGGIGRARILKGKHMPGHMGNERRTLSGVKVLRINYKYNVIWVKGAAVPGGVHSYVTIRDSRLVKHKEKRTEESLPFPTHFPEDGTLEEEALSDDLFPMHAPTIEYAEETKAAKSK